MQRYSLFIGVVGVLAGLSLIFYINMFPKPAPVKVAPLPAENLVYNVGKTHALPGTESMLYENAALGLRFGYPKSYGEVVVENKLGEIDFSFSLSGATNDPRRARFMVAQTMEPTGHEPFWGDLSWYSMPDPRWKQQPTVCSLLKGTVDSNPLWVKALIADAPCTDVPLAEGGLAKLTTGDSSLFLIPALQTAADGVSFDALAVTDMELMDAKIFADPSANLEKLVNSLDFIPAEE